MKKLIATALNGTVIYGIVWEFFISDDPANWLAILASILSVGFLGGIIFLLTKTDYI